MCGHFGMAGRGILPQDLDILKDLGCISDIYRGGDGSGVYQVNSAANSSKFKNNYEYLHKTLFPFSVMMYDLSADAKEVPELKSFLSSCMPDVFIGHVRAATLGRISDSNSHPFSFQNIVGAHNGTLKDDKYIDKDKLKTDSELLFSDINNRGIIPVINELDDNSAYAIVQYDRNYKKIYLYRNDKRSFYVAFNEERNVIYWASDSSFLRFVLNRRSIKHSVCATRPHVIYEIDPTQIQMNKGTSNLRMFHKFQQALDWENEQKRKKEEGEFKKSQEKNDVSSSWPSDTVTKIFSTVLDKSQSASITTNISCNIGDNILSFSERKKDKDLKDNSVKNFHQKCECGSVTFNTLQCNLARRGKSNSQAIYNKETNTFHCIGCNPNKIIQEVNKNVLH